MNRKIFLLVILSISGQAITFSLFAKNDGDATSITEIKDALKKFFKEIKSLSDILIMPSEYENFNKVTSRTGPLSFSKVINNDEYREKFKQEYSKLVTYAVMLANIFIKRIDYVQISISAKKLAIFAKSYSEVMSHIKIKEKNSLNDNADDKNSLKEDQDDLLDSLKRLNEKFNDVYTQSTTIKNLTDSAEEFVKNVGKAVKKLKLPNASQDIRKDVEISGSYSNKAYYIHNYENQETKFSGMMDKFETEYQKFVHNFCKVIDALKTKCGAKKGNFSEKENKEIKESFEKLERKVKGKRTRTIKHAYNQLKRKFDELFKLIDAKTTGNVTPLALSSEEASDEAIPDGKKSVSDEETNRDKLSADSSNSSAGAHKNDVAYEDNHVPTHAIIYHQSESRQDGSEIPQEEINEEGLSPYEDSLIDEQVKATSDPREPDNERVDTKVNSSSSDSSSADNQLEPSQPLTASPEASSLHAASNGHLPDEIHILPVHPQRNEPQQDSRIVLMLPAPNPEDLYETGHRHNPPDSDRSESSNGDHLKQNKQTPVPHHVIDIPENYRDPEWDKEEPKLSKVVKGKKQENSSSSSESDQSTSNKQAVHHEKTDENHATKKLDHLEYHKESEHHEKSGRSSAQDHLKKDPKKSKDDKKSDKSSSASESDQSKHYKKSKDSEETNFHSAPKDDSSGQDVQFHDLPETQAHEIDDHSAPAEPTEQPSNGDEQPAPAEGGGALASIYGLLGKAASYLRPS